ncbi:hypothetical protein WJX72_011785 [[Myrmecia] bisecta]|uniref:peptidyl-tRNA hydrolase n=1 Tax=[Myrmecia] bisecta TaxID=41462 RepID=A0AAW1PUS2_9CHLO
MKMVLVVRMDLKMGRGKIAAQCCHAAVGQWKKMWRAKDPDLKQWELSGATKICLQAEDERQLHELKTAAKEAGLPTRLVLDAGRTQIAPNTYTVLAIGPASAERLDRVTGNLKLL